jgi:ABC-type phosphate transport system substrate-binding protein
MHGRIAILVCAGALFLGFPAVGAAEDFLVIVNKDNANAVGADFVAKAYRGEAKSWPSGGNIAPVALGEDNATRAAFDKAVLGKSPNQSRALWAQLAFTGKAVPPKMVDSDEDVVKAVLENHNAIGYVSPKAKVDGVRVIK